VFGHVLAREEYAGREQNRKSHHTTNPTCTTQLWFPPWDSPPLASDVYLTPSSLLLNLALVLPSGEKSGGQRVICLACPRDEG